MGIRLRCSYAYFAESGDCLFSSSTKWVIDFGALDHMTDLKAKEIIGRGRKCDGLYVFKPKVSKSLVGLSSSSLFEARCRLGHPSLQSLKKFCPEYSHLSSLNCDSFHFDVWGPYPITSKSGFKYFVTFIDDYSGVTWLYLMKNRSEVFTHFRSFVAEIKTQFHVTVQTLRKRKNRHLLKVARALLFQMTLPKPFWADDVSTASFLIKRMPSAVLDGNYLYSVIFPTKPLFPIDPKIFGSTCFVQDTQPNITKLNPKSLKCVFLGYSRIHKGYRCYSHQLHRYLVSRDVIFHEDLPYFPVTTYRHQEENNDLSDLIHEPSTQLKDAPNDVSNDASNDVSNDVPISAPSEACGKSDAPSGSDSPSPSPTPKLDLPIALRKDSILVPKTVGEALAHSGWRAAMIEEMNALDHNDTWALVVLPELHQLDMKNAFLHGDLEEEVYMEQPSGFVAQGEYGRVCKLKKDFYGLKQSSRACFGIFSNAVIKFGLRKSVYDYFVFYSSSNACCILLVVYVDDIVITGSDKAGIKILKSFIGTCFHTKDLGSLKYFLGIKVSRSSKGICLSQRKYYLDLLDDAGQIEAKPCDEPMIPKLKLRSEEGRLLHNLEKYRRVVGKLNYLTITCPDIAFSVSVVSQFMTAPRMSH
nr:polyprotein, putative [Tanacetum cinerariifolium]